MKENGESRESERKKLHNIMKFCQEASPAGPQNWTSIIYPLAWLLKKERGTAKKNKYGGQGKGSILRFLCSLSRFWYNKNLIFYSNW